MILSTRLCGRVFLHFFDVHFLEEKGYTGGRLLNIEYECNMATRIAILTADEVLIPAASFFESPLCYKIVHQLNDLYSFGNIKLIGSGSSVIEYFDDKLRQYEKKSLQYKIYKENQKRHPELLPPFLSRKSSASKDIKNGWTSRLEGKGLSSVIDGSGFKATSNFETLWNEVPDKLETRAFIVPHVEPLLFSDPIMLPLRNRLHGVINEEYFGSFTREFNSGVCTDLGYLEAISIPSFGRNLPYKAITTELRKHKNMLKYIERANGIELLELKHDPQVIAALHQAFEYHEQKVIEMSPVNNSNETSLLVEATIGIITALPEEFAAVMRVMDNSVPISAPGQGGGRTYAVSKIVNNEGKTHTVAVTMLSDMGNNSAAVRATLMKVHCPNVEHIIMTGIAGAVPHPEKPDVHVRLGDIVVSDRNGVIQYDLDKEFPTEIENRYPPRPPSPLILEAHQWLVSESLLGKFPWDDYIEKAITTLGDQWRRPNEEQDILTETTTADVVKHPKDPGRRQGSPRVFNGPIASANKLLKHAAKRDTLRDKFRVKAVEMEGSGIADATWNSEVGYFVVRGTCDYCDIRKSDVWHFYASVIAAAYTKAVIERMPVR